MDEHAVAAWEVVLPDGTRRLLTSSLTVGRAPDNDLQLDDRTVSRRHLRLELWPDGPLAVDAGSSHGTFVDGSRVVRPTPVRDGGRVRLGEVELVLERVRSEDEAGRTIRIEAGATAFVDALPDGSDPEVQAHATSFGLRPRVRSGWALKRLDASEGERRFVLKDLRGGGFVRMTAAEAELFELIDGSRTLVDLIAAAEERLGPTGPGRLASLLADLGDRGMLAGVTGRAQVEQRSFLARLMRPRELVLPAAGRLVDAVYRAGGRHLVTKPAAIVLALLALAGLAAFAYLVARRYGTPFVVARHIGLGGAVFLAGRLALVALHELAHGLAVESCGRRVQRAGIKVVGPFPYGFVDTSDAWFEPRRRRLVITAAGPACDLALGGAFAIASLAIGAGTTRDIFFQLAFGAYLGAFMNLNPVLDRDGYQLLVDALREPGLRPRAREHLRARLAGRPTGEASRAVRLYGVLGLVWTVVGGLLVLGLTYRYYDLMVAVAPRKEIVWAVFAALTVAVLAPALLVVGRGLWERRRAEADDGGA